MRRKSGKKGRNSPVHFQREEHAPARGRETLIFMETIKFAGTHDPHEERRGEA